MAAEAALVQMSPSLEGEGVLSGNALISRLPVEIDVAVPIRKFRVRNLLTLEAGHGHCVAVEGRGGHAAGGAGRPTGLDRI